MKVLMITTSYPDFPGSHRGLFIRKLCLQLKSQGLEIQVLTPRIHSKSPCLEEDEGISIQRFRFPSGNRPLHQMESIPLLPMTIYMASGLIKALQLTARWRPHVIHGNWIIPTGLIAALAGRSFGVPVMNTARGMDLRISERQPLRSLFDLTVRLSDMVTVVSPSMRERRILSNAAVTPTGVDEVFFGIRPGRDTLNVVFTRSLEPVYNAETLIRSIPLVTRCIPEARFIIAGTGSQEPFLKGLAREIGADASTTFLGHVPPEKIPSLMERASVFVSPAVADGTSIALLESIAAGLTPVVSDIEANRSLVQEGKDGFLFEPRDAKGLAMKIIAALSCSIPAELLENRRKEYWGRVSWTTVAGGFMARYKELSRSNP